MRAISPISMGGVYGGKGLWKVSFEFRAENTVLVIDGDSGDDWRDELI